MADRGDVRADFGARVTSEMVGEGKPIKVVYPYTVDDFAGQSSVLIIGSGGTERSPLTFAGGKADYLLDVFIFILYAEMDDTGKKLNLDADGNPTWSEADSEAALDLAEQQLGEFIFQRETQKGNGWKSITYNLPTQTSIVPVGGVPYRREWIQLRFSSF